MRFLRTFWGPSWLLCFLSLEFCYICYFCDFCDICHRCFQLARKILVTLAIFAVFADISGPFLVSSFSKSGILLNFVIFAISAIFVTSVFSSQEKSLLLLRYLRTFRGPSWLLCFVSLQFCYICYFCDFCNICHGCFQLARKILVTFAIFADILGPFLASLLSKSGILLHLLFLRFLRYLSRVFSACKKNPCYPCHFCGICGHFVFF